MLLRDGGLSADRARLPGRPHEATCRKVEELRIFSGWRDLCCRNQAGRLHVPALIETADIRLRVALRWSWTLAKNPRAGLGPCRGSHAV
jgi:hypothetical protein